MCGPGCALVQPQAGRQLISAALSSALRTRPRRRATGRGERPGCRPRLVRTSGAWKQGATPREVAGGATYWHTSLAFPRRPRAGLLALAAAAAAAAAPSSAIPPYDLVTLLSLDPYESTLVTAVQAAGLVPALQSKGPFTGERRPPGPTRPAALSPRAVLWL